MLNKLFIEENIFCQEKKFGYLASEKVKILVDNSENS
jgi:hypothetical protein